MSRTFKNNIVIDYLKSLYLNNHDLYIEACENILRFVMNDVLTFANHDLQKEIGNKIVTKEGYDLLIDLFSRTIIHFYLYVSLSQHSHHSIKRL